MVAVQNAQRVSDALFLEKTSTVATPIEPDIFRVLARAISSLPSAGLQEVDLDLDGDPDPALRQAGRDRDAGGLVGQRGDHAAMEMAEELHQIVAARQCEFGMPGSTATMRKPAAPVKPLALMASARLGGLSFAARSRRDAHRQ